MPTFPNNTINEIQSEYSPSETYLHYEPDLLYKDMPLMIKPDVPLYFTLGNNEGYIRINLENGEVEIKNMTLTEASQKFWELVSFEYKQYVAWKESFNK